MVRRNILLVVFLALGATFAYQLATRQEPESGPPRPRPRVPTKGTVRLDGKPLKGAVIFFMPMDAGGTATSADTEEDGSYDLVYQGFPGGTAPGRYKVYISYLISPEGKTVGLDLRGGVTPAAVVFISTERLPPKYSHMGKSEFIRVVPPGGGTFDFDLEGPLLPLPDPKAKAASPAPAPEATTKGGPGGG